MAATKQGNQQVPVLVARRVDSWLVGWLAVAIWVGAYAVHVAGIRFGFNVVAPVYWAGAVVTAAHFGLSYHLAYGLGPDGIRARRFALVGAPAALFLVLGTLAAAALLVGTAQTRWVMTYAVTSVFVFTTWHYIKQVYGVARVGAAFAGVRLSKREADVLRYALYPVAWAGGALVLVRGANYATAGYLVGIGIFPRSVLEALRLLTIVGAVAIAVVFIRIRRRGPLPSLLLAPYVAAFLWLAMPTSTLLLIVLLAPMHAIQYLAIGHRAEVAVARGRDEPIGVTWWLNIFVAAACGGLLLGRWLPMLLDNWSGNASGSLLFAALFFVGLNLHHYVIDATIWRSSGELVRAVARPVGRVTAAPTAVSSPTGALTPAVAPG